MKIWVDADACPVVIKNILFKAAERTRIKLTLVANQRMRYPQSPFIDFLQVVAGADVADNAIVDRVEPGDLVITADIPLAANIVEKGAIGLDPRGELYTEENVRARLDVRDFMSQLREDGVKTGGPSEISQSNRQAFANNLDSFLTKSTDDK